MTSERIHTHTHTNKHTHTNARAHAKCLEAAAVSLLPALLGVISRAAAEVSEENKKKSSSRERLNFWKSWKPGRKGPG